MLLNNFFATMYPGTKITDTCGATTEGKTYFPEHSIISKSGEWYSETPLPNLDTYVFAPFNRGIALGSGTTPPQKTDYKLENYIATGLTYSGHNTSQANAIANWVETVQNTSTEPITIAEVGLFSMPNQRQKYHGNYLLTRTVLDTPVVLQPNEVKTFTITIDYSKFVDGTIIQNS